MWTNTFAARSRLRLRSITLELTKKVIFAYPYFATRYVRGPVFADLFLTVCAYSGSLPLHCRLVGSILHVMGDHCVAYAVLCPVLAIIQEKVNNPSPDDPFEPEIAAVSASRPSLMCEMLPGITPVLIRGHQLMKTDYSRFQATAKEWTKK